MSNLEELAIKQGKQIEALEYLIRKVELEPVIDDLDYCITTYGKNPTLESHREVLIDCWEKLNQPFKWDQE